MLDNYFYVEDSFIEISRIIPLDNPNETYSPRLYELLQTICSQVENLSKIISDKLELKPQEMKFPYIYEELNKNKILDEQAVDLYKLPGGKAIRPLIKTGKYAPKWWDEYNNSKHNLPEGFKAGNVENVPIALAGLYVLHVMAHFLRFSRRNFLKKDSWHTIDSISLNRDNREVIGGVMYEGPKSKIFLPLTYFSGEGPLI